MTLYSLRSPSTITKWDADGNPEATYDVSFDACTCPAGHRPTCRHRQMLSHLLPLIDTEWFWDFDRGLDTDFNGTPRDVVDPTWREPAQMELLSPSECEGSYELAVNAIDVTPLKTQPATNPDLPIFDGAVSVKYDENGKAQHGIPAWRRL